MPVDKTLDKNKYTLGILVIKKLQPLKKKITCFFSSDFGIDTSITVNPTETGSQTLEQNRLQAPGIINK